MPKVLFKQSGVEVEWDGSHESLLELAEDHGLDLDFGCRMGNCTACQQPVVKGEVEYPNGHTGEPDEGNELLCCSVPKDDIEIDA
ncbi:MAG: 2Fe-2S iron-sulfur cluster binding domain-containing protein [Opitutales bacterium]|nr:2Fe-2S iron-sulfur cluster binding domain-containing protein [Opitutales bacterium]